MLTEAIKKLNGDIKVYVIVLCPLNVAGTWEREWQRWMVPDNKLNVVKLQSSDYDNVSEGTQCYLQLFAVQRQ